MGIGAGIVAISGIAAGWGIAIDIAIGVGLGAWGAHRAKKLAEKARDTNERKQIIRAEAAPKNWIYGKNRSAGVLAFAQEQAGEQDSGEGINLVIAYAGHELESVEDIYFDDTPVDDFTSDVPSYISYKHYLAGSDVADDHLLAECPDFKPTMLGKGVAWGWVKLVYDASVFPAGLPGINVLKRGKPVEDIRTGNKIWSDNPALCILDYLRAKGWEDDYIILDTFKEAANICDEMVLAPDGSTSTTKRVPEYGLMEPSSENYATSYWKRTDSTPSQQEPTYDLYYEIYESGSLVSKVKREDFIRLSEIPKYSQSSTQPVTVGTTTYYPSEWAYVSGSGESRRTKGKWYKVNEVPAYGKQEKRYALGCEFDDSEEMASVLDKMLNACAGSWIKIGGRIGLRVGAYYGPALIDITDDEIIGSIEIQPEIDRANAFNVARGTYINPDENYTKVDYPEVRVEEWVNEDGEEIIMDLNFDYVQSHWQAQRLADIAMKKARLGMIMSIPCNLRAFNCTPGTMINLSIASLGFKDQEFLVVDWEFDFSGGITLKVQRDMPEFYDDAVGEPIEIPPWIDLPSGGVATPEHLSFIPKIVGDVVQGVITWKNSIFKLDRTEITIKDGTGKIVHAESVPFPGEELPVGGKVAGDYTVEAVAVGVNGAKSLPAVMTVDIEAPSKPTNIGLYPSNNGMEVRPNYGANEMPVATLFEFFTTTKADYDANNYPTGNPRARGYIWTETGLIPDTQYYYFVRAANPYGVSDFAKATEKTTANYDELLPVPEGSIDWDHLDDAMQGKIDDIINNATETEHKVDGIGDDVTHVTQEFNTYKTDNDAALAQMKTDISSGDSHVLSEANSYTDSEGNKLAQKIDTVETGLSSVQQKMSAVEDDLGNQEAYWQVAASVGDVKASIAVVASSQTGRGQVIATADDFVITNKPGGTLQEQPFVFQNGALFLNSAIIKELDSINIYAAYIANSRSNPTFEIDGKAGKIKGADIEGSHIKGGYDRCSRQH